jgi:sorbitol-specific phosphotransferase system component IIBC
MEYVPAGLLVVALQLYVAAILSPFVTPAMVPANTGKVWPMTQVALAAVTVKSAADPAKGAQGGQQVNGFQDVGFSLGVVAQEEMEAGGEVGLQSPVIAKVAQFEMSQMHGYRIQVFGADARTKKPRRHT